MQDVMRNTALLLKCRAARTPVASLLGSCPPLPSRSKNALDSASASHYEVDRIKAQSFAGRIGYKQTCLPAANRPDYIEPKQNDAMSKLLDPLQETIRCMRTELAYVNWARLFILFHQKQHPLDMGEPGPASFCRIWPPSARRRLPLRTRP
jgi:hypothetical protein